MVPRSDAVDFTSQSLFELRYLPVPHDLADFVTTFYHFRCDEPEVRDVQPAGVGHLTVFPYGEGCLSFRDGRTMPAHRVNLLTPFSLAVPFVMAGPFHAIGAVFTPLGWAAVTGLCATAHGNKICAARDYLGDDIEDVGQEICRRYRQDASTAEQGTDALAAFIRGNLHSVPDKHRELIRTTNQWLSAALNPSLDDLHCALPYSQRQAQRLIERYFGLPPRSLVRKYRALRAAAWLSLPHLSDEAEAELAEAFYDQPHMIREIQLFVGRTPARLGSGSHDYLNEMLDLRNFREITAA
ncbi:AraC family transcriptional regulator [Porphyrobacter sp. GA68]|uniref:AraC family transcriptional regulator n=1 Tax=Porphyrobacter sp. GA68 TaxID=2883480 RepID=UPI001D194566|nr:AraC family transcriptional regulator [Porphyrobacter sp. GA68]